MYVHRDAESFSLNAHIYTTQNLKQSKNYYTFFGVKRSDS